MPIKTYTDKTSLIIDLKLWLSWQQGSEPNLSLFPIIASNRWTWVVANWESQFYKQFLELSNGDEYLLEVLQILDNHVFAWNEGSQVNPFNDMTIFSDAAEFLELISVSALAPIPSETQFIGEEIRKISEFDQSNFQQMLNFLRTQRDIAFDFIGLGDPLYDNFRNRNQSPKQRDFFVLDLFQLNDAIEMEKFIQGIMLDFKYNKNISPNLLAFANQQLAAGASDIRAEDIFNSFFTVPFEQSLEQMATDYLGDQSRWFELVTVNNLKSPYVDLYGVKSLITENASGNSVRVPITEQAKFQVGASLKIGSRLVPEEIRQVEVVRDNNDGTFSLFLSGKQDLAKLKLIHLAYIRVYHPETVTDFSFVKIPVSAVAPNSNIPEPTIGELKRLDKALLAFGVDVARDDRFGDLIISTTGDLAIQYGIANVRQAARSLINTELGSLPLHRNYGLPETAGFALEGADSAARISTIIETAMKRDPRFTSVTISDIVISAEGRISMSLAVSIAGSSQLIPLAFVV